MVVRGVALTLAAFVLAGCGPREIPPPRAEPTLREDLPAELAEAVRVREVFGLRADPEHVALVADDPTATSDMLGIPLLPDEAAAMERRFAAQDRLERLAAYGAEHTEEFGGMYIDQQAGGDVVLLFTGSLDRHRVAVAALAPRGANARVRRVDFTEQELTQLLDSLMRGDLHAMGFQPMSGGVDIMRNVVTLEGKSDVPDLEQRLERLHAGMLDVTVHPVPGPWQNATEGEGWRLLESGESQHTGSPVLVRVALDAPAFDALWAEAGFVDALPVVDFHREFVVAFGFLHSSTCREVRLDDVVIRAEERLVFARNSDPLAPRPCTSDAVGPASFFVAVERDALGPGDVTIQLHERSVPCEPGCWAQEQVTVRLD